MDAPEVPSSPYSEAFRVKVAVDLRFIAGALRDRLSPANTLVLELAGWTIFRAARGGLLAGTLDISKCVDANLRDILERGVPLVISEDTTTTLGSPVHRDPINVIERFILELKQHDDSSATPRDWDSAESHASKSLLMRAFHVLASAHRAELPDEIKRLYLLGNTVEDLIFQSRACMEKAAWTCQFLADKIDPGGSLSDDSSWLTESEAAERADCWPGQISRAKEIKSNGKTGRHRRFEPNSVDAYAKRLGLKRESVVQMKDEQDQLGEKNGWVCKNCQRSHKSGDRPKTCTACEGHRFEPARRT